ncbi:hypothetical protein EV121DRAFT_296414 [Schizophyllum commune]
MRGDTTSIPYYERYESYLEIINTHLNRRSVAMRETFRIWDSEIFPGTTSSIVRSHRSMEGSDENSIGEVLARADEEEIEPPSDEEQLGGEDTQRGSQIDGVDSGLHIIEKDRKSSKIYIRDVLVSPTESRKFQFGALDLTDDDAYLGTNQRRIGEIVVKFWRSRINGSSGEMDANATIQDPSPVHEKGKKGFLHVVRLGEAGSISAQSGITARKLDDKPLAVFTFYYRGIDVLRADGIAPKPASEELVSLCSTLDFAVTPTRTAVKRKASEELLPELPKLKAEDEEVKPTSEFIVQPHTSDWTKLKHFWPKTQRVDCRHGKTGAVKSEKALSFVPGEVIDLTGD